MLRCISVVRVWCHDLFGVCACARVCVCVRATRRNWGVCASNKISTKRVVSTSPKAQCRERRRARRRSCGYASSPSPRRCMTASRPSVARTRTGRPALSGCTRRDRMHEERALSCPARASIGLLSGAIFESFASKLSEMSVCEPFQPKPGVCEPFSLRPNFHDLLPGVDIRC